MFKVELEWSQTETAMGDHPMGCAKITVIVHGNNCSQKFIPFEIKGISFADANHLKRGFSEMARSIHRETLNSTINTLCKELDLA